MCPETGFDGSVEALLGSIDGQGRQREGFPQFFPKCFGEVRHIREGACVFLPDPFPNLFGAKGRFIQLLQRVGQLFGREMTDILHGAKVICLGENMGFLPACQLGSKCSE